MEKLLTPTELADQLQIPLQTVYKWRSGGSGPAGFRVGRHVRFSPTDVESWLETLRDRPTGKESMK